MVFTLNEEHKRTWNKGYWKRTTQGRVLTAMAVIGLVTFALMLPGYIDAYRAFDAYASLDQNVPDDAAVRFFVSIFALGVQLVFMACAIPAANAGSAPSIEGERLYTSGAYLCFDRIDKVMGVFTIKCMMENCSFAWSEKERLLHIYGDSDEDVRYGTRPGYAEAESAPFEELTPCGEMNFAPYFDPDPIAYLREHGMREKK